MRASTYSSSCHTLRKLNLAGAGMNSKRGAGNGNSNARVLHFMLAKNKAVEELVLSDTGLDDVRVYAIVAIRIIFLSVFVGWHC
jgi:hypothetical protein